MLDKRACSFCDSEKETPERLPACTRPPTRKIRTEMFGRPVILDVCQHHYDRMPEDSKPNQFIGTVVDGFPAESELGFQTMMGYLRRENVVELACKGCGGILVRYHEHEGIPGVAMQALGIDLLVIKDHLDRCDFRRTK